MNTRTRPPTLCRVVAAAVPLALAGLCATALPASAFADGNGDPAGNNGTVKVTSHNEDDGTPEAPCTFDIEWYGFDEGAHIISRVEFTMQAPRSELGFTVAGPSEVFVGGDPASGAGTDSGFDGAATYTLVSNGPANPQGHHVKVTVHTPGSQGADTKHKVFWVRQPCEQPPPPPPNL